MPRAEIVRYLERLGGVASRSELRQAFTSRAISQAVRDDLIVRDAPGRYALTSAREGRRAARRLNAVAIGRTAAALWGMKLKTPPPRPELAVPRGRRVSRAEQQRCAVSWRSLDPGDIRHGELTSPVRTVIDCAVSLPFDEALAIADSALRAAFVSTDDLAAAARAIPRSGRRQAMRVAEHASGLAQNPFESALRAISLDVPGLRLVPQVPIRVAGRLIHPDLTDRRLRIVAEGDSHEFHTSRRQIDIDCERYTELTLDDWIVLRFSHPQAMGRQTWVRDAFARAVAFRMTTTKRRATPA